MYLAARCRNVGWLPVFTECGEYGKRGRKLRGLRPSLQTRDARDHWRLFGVVARAVVRIPCEDVDLIYGRPHSYRFPGVAVPHHGHVRARRQLIRLAAQGLTKAELMGPQAPYSWTLWESLWELAEPGEYSILARTTSTGGLSVG